MEFNHYSVMLHDTIEQLNIRPDGIYVDGTLRGGGHAYEVCSRLQNEHFYGIYQEDAASAAASERLRCCGDKVTVIRNDYVNAVEALSEYGVSGVDGIVLDLG
ncbi:16S rRNA (cytosine(1402)-N(4))-methyltransferase, partial [Muribaculaceae bacterium Isolate-002 (NCI)]